MSLIRNFALHLAYLGLFLQLVFTGTASYAAEISSPVAIADVAKECPAPPATEGLHIRSVFSHLKNVLLYVPYLWTYEEAAKCRGREDECVAERNKNRSIKQRKREANEMRKQNAIFPTALLSAQLTKLFKSRIEKRIMPFVERSASCEVPEVRVVDSKTIWKEASTPDTLTIVVKVSIVDDPTFAVSVPAIDNPASHASPTIKSTQPPIAILGYGYYRPENADLQSQQFLEEVTAVPLNLASDQITQRVEAFINNPQRFLTHIPGGKYPKEIP